MKHAKYIFFLFMVFSVMAQENTNNTQKNKNTDPALVYTIDEFTTNLHAVDILQLSDNVYKNSKRSLKLVKRLRSRLMLTMFGIGGFIIYNIASGNLTLKKSNIFSLSKIKKSIDDFIDSFKTKSETEILKDVYQTTYKQIIKNIPMILLGACALFVLSEISKTEIDELETQKSIQKLKAGITGLRKKVHRNKTYQNKTYQEDTFWENDETSENSWNIIPIIVGLSVLASGLILAL